MSERPIPPQRTKKKKAPLPPAQTSGLDQHKEDQNDSNSSSSLNSLSPQASSFNLIQQQVPLSSPITHLKNKKSSSQSPSSTYNVEQRLSQSFIPRNSRERSSSKDRHHDYDQRKERSDKVGQFGKSALKATKVTGKVGFKLVKKGGKALEKGMRALSPNDRGGQEPLSSIEFLLRSHDRKVFAIFAWYLLLVLSLFSLGSIVLSIYTYISLQGKGKIINENSYESFPLHKILKLLVLFVFIYFAFVMLNKYQLVEEEDEAGENRHEAINYYSSLVMFLKLSCIIIGLILVYTMYRNISDSKVLKEGVSNRILDAIKLYDKDVGIKKELNNLQISSQCCGSEGHGDWKSLKGVSVPFSCCNKRSLHPCHFKDVDNSLNTFIENDVVETINTNGCKAVIEKRLSSLTEIIRWYYLFEFIVFYAYFMIITMIDTSFISQHHDKKDPPVTSFPTFLFGIFVLVMITFVYLY